MKFYSTMDINKMAKGILIPELILYRLLNKTFQMVKTDYEDSSPKSESFLNILFDQDENNEVIGIETMNFLEQAHHVLIENRPQVNIGYNLEVADKPSVHILLPNENSRPFTIGADEGYQEFNINTKQEGDPAVDVEYAREVFTKVFDSTYQIIITSENIFEVLIIYQFLKASLISVNQHLELIGLRDFKMSGADVNMQQDLIPKNIFHRTISLNFFHEVNVPHILRSKLIKIFTSTGIKDV